MNLLTVDDVILLHDLAAPEAPLLDRSKLDSAVHRPAQHLAYATDATIHDLAAVLAEGICQAHAFADGNKRAAVLAVSSFYAVNGYVFDAPDAELVHLIVDLTTHDADAAKTADLFSLWSVPRAQEDG